MKIFKIDFKAVLKPAGAIFISDMVVVSLNLENAVQGHLNANTGIF